jgi:hypothetical protein
MANFNVVVSAGDLVVLNLVLGSSETPAAFIQRRVNEAVIKPTVATYRRAQMARVMAGLNTTNLVDFKTILTEVETVMRNHGLLV